LEIKTNRLALQNYDWTSLNGEEIFFLFNSHLEKSEFKGKFDKTDSETENGLKNVKIYVSDFGEKRLAEEKNHGPKKIFEKLKEKFEKKGLLTENNPLVSEMINNDPLVRQYEIDRLKYFYAVLEFESEDVADWVYANCDGLEFEKSGMQIDLRGIPKDLKIPKKAKEIVRNAKNLNPALLKKKKIKNLAKNHTHVELTWGEGRVIR
jgi:hypothetical protein